MSKTYKETKKSVEKELKQRKVALDEDGRAIINMIVKDDRDFLSVFSEYETPVISNQVAGFIEESANSFLPKQPLSLNIYSDCIDDNEKVVYKKAIKEYYLEKYQENQREILRNTFISIGLAILGVLFIVLRVLFDTLVGGLIWSEVIDILAWVLLWEAFDIIVLGTRSMRNKKLRYLSFLSMKINFEERNKLNNNQNALSFESK